MSFLNVSLPVSPSIRWDEWDEVLWTPEQRHLRQEGVPSKVLATLSTLLTLIALFGIVAIRDT